VGGWVLFKTTFELNEPHTFGARLLLKSVKGWDVMDHCGCAQFCFIAMCSMSIAEDAVLLIRFPRRGNVCIPCITVEKRTLPRGVEWLVDSEVVQSPIKLDFEQFPRAAVQVQAWFGCGAGFDPPIITEAITDCRFVDREIVEQELNFVYNDNLSVSSLDNIIGYTI